MLNRKYNALLCRLLAADRSGAKTRNPALQTWELATGDGCGGGVAGGPEQAGGLNPHDILWSAAGAGVAGIRCDQCRYVF